MSNRIHGPRHWGHSLRELSWDESIQKTKSQELISSTIHEWYDAKHRISSQEEITLVNSIKCTHCPYCDSEHIVHNGSYRNGIKRFLCKSCNRSFNSLTHTIFDDRKYLSVNG